jgi:hypothetical protein
MYWIMGKWRIKDAKGRKGFGNAWLVYSRSYNECKKEKKLPSPREVNASWGGKPNAYWLTRRAYLSTQAV